MQGIEKETLPGDARTSPSSSLHVFRATSVCTYKRNHPIGLTNYPIVHLNRSIIYISIQFISMKSQKRPVHLLFEEVHVRQFIDVAPGRTIWGVVIINNDRCTFENGFRKTITCHLKPVTCKLRPPQFSTIERILLLTRLRNF